MDGSAQYVVDTDHSLESQAQRLELQDQEIGVQVSGKIFKATREFWPQTLEVFQFLKDYPDAVHSLHFSGDTANAAIFNTPNGTPRPFQVLGSNDGLQADTFPEPGKLS